MHWKRHLTAEEPSQTKPNWGVSCKIVPRRIVADGVKIDFYNVPTFKQLLFGFWTKCLFLRLDVVFANKTIGIVAKSSKLLQDALATVLHKHQLKQEDVVITIVSMFELCWLCSSIAQIAINQKMWFDSLNRVSFSFLG